MFNIGIFDIQIIFKLAGLGLAVVLINRVLKECDAGSYVFYTTLVGIITALLVVIQYISRFFQAVQTMFRF